MQQHTLKPKRGSTHRHKRRGIGDTFAGRGVKGQKSRVGGRSKFGAGFEGGQISLIRRMPKLGGFRNINRVEFQPVNLADLEKLEIVIKVDVCIEYNLRTSILEFARATIIRTHMRNFHHSR